MGFKKLRGKESLKLTVSGSRGHNYQNKGSGKGIPSDLIEDIFEPLSTTKQQETGLVLASVKSIINGHDGRLFVTSPPTIFTIKIPKRRRPSNLQF